MSERDRSKERSESDTFDQRGNKREQEECVRWRWRTAAKAKVKVKSKFGMSKEVLSLQLNKSQQSYDGRRHNDVARTSEPLNRYRYNCRCRCCVRHYR